MAFGATTYYDAGAAAPGLGFWEQHVIDCTLSTVAQTAPRQLVPIYDNEAIEVLGLECITAGTSSATVALGYYTAAAAEGDLDAFVAAVDMSAAAMSRGNATLGGVYVNKSGATQYLCLTTGTADDAAGKYVVHYRKFPVPTPA
jgi:hypothetical protein